MPVSHAYDYERDQAGVRVTQLTSTSADVAWANQQLAGYVPMGAKQSDYIERNGAYERAISSGESSAISGTGDAYVREEDGDGGRSTWRDAMQRAYGLQREQATAENEAERVRAEERMKGRMASGGFEGGSMLQEKMLGNLDIGSQKALAGRLGQIDIAESAAMGDRDAQFQLAAMNNDFATGRMTLADQLQTTRETGRAVAESYFNRGLAGEKLTDSELESLRTSNPAAYSAYISGQSGKTIEDFNRDYDRQTAYTNALIMRLDPLDPDFSERLNSLYSQMYPGAELYSPTSTDKLGDFFRWRNETMPALGTIIREEE